MPFNAKSSNNFDAQDDTMFDGVLDYVAKAAKEDLDYPRVVSTYDFYNLPIFL